MLHVSFHRHINHRYSTDRVTAAVSPWFSTHFGLEVTYSKNWVFPSDLLWFDRWTEILNLGSQFVEIQTWYESESLVVSSTGRLDKMLTWA